MYGTESGNGSKSINTIVKVTTAFTTDKYLQFKLFTNMDLKFQMQSANCNYRTRKNKQYYYNEMSSLQDRK